MALPEELASDWRSRLKIDCPDVQPAAQDSIIHWLLGEDLGRFEDMAPEQLTIAKQAMDYRYRILQQRYLGVHPDLAYRKLIQRLGSLFLIRSKIRTWVALSRDRGRTVMDVLQEVIQELIQSDNYIRQQMIWIGQCTSNPRLRNSLMLASVEEYCLRPIRNQPLLVYRFVNYLRRSQRGGMTQVPTDALIRLVSDEITPDENEGPISLLDAQAATQYQDSQNAEEQQALRENVRREFCSYLEKTIDPVAVQWLQLHLQGKTQETIAQSLNLPIKQVYRLREKISYHAVNFALKAQPDLVTTWLGTSLKEHNLGFTPAKFDEFFNTLESTQQAILHRLKAGETTEAIAKDLDMKPNQVMSEWIKIYLLSQEFRKDS